MKAVEEKESLPKLRVTQKRKSDVNRPLALARKSMSGSSSGLIPREAAEAKALSIERRTLDSTEPSKGLALGFPLALVSVWSTETAASVFLEGRYRALVIGVFWGIDARLRLET